MFDRQQEIRRAVAVRRRGLGDKTLTVPTKYLMTGDLLPWMTQSIHCRITTIQVRGAWTRRTMTFCIRSNNLFESMFHSYDATPPLSDIKKATSKSRSRSDVTALIRRKRVTLCEKRQDGVHRKKNVVLLTTVIDVQAVYLLEHT